MEQGVGAEVSITGSFVWGIIHLEGSQEEVYCICLLNASLRRQSGEELHTGVVYR